MNDPDCFAAAIRFTRFMEGRYSHWSSLAPTVGVTEEGGSGEVARALEDEQRALAVA